MLILRPFTAEDAKDQVEDAKKNSDDTPHQPGTSIEGANHSSDDEERMDMSDSEDTDDERKVCRDRENRGRY